MIRIDRFFGEYRWLSNFWYCDVVLEGVTYPSVEHAYQAAKYPPDERSLFLVCSTKDAKRLGRGVRLPPDWEERKVALMSALLAQKFAPGTVLADRLLGTGEAELIEGNTWGDTFWGRHNGQGQNVLGALLMAQRDQLRVLQPC